MRSRLVNRDEWTGRLDNARAFLRAAQREMDLADEHENANPAMSQLVLAAIGYGDALTIRFAGVQNDDDHTALPATLRRALGNRANAEQIARLTRILGRKDQVQYQHRRGTVEEARELMKQVRRFAEWAEAELQRP